jgi:membrane fusion protein (multidrug efflux system)
MSRLRDNDNFRALLLLTVAGSALVWLAGCGESSDEPNRAPVPVRLAKVQPKTFRRTLEGIGTIEAVQRVEIRPDADGFVEEIRFRRGQQVQAGDVLFVLDAEELRQQLASRQAQRQAVSARLARAQRSYRRYRDMYQEGASATEELDRVRSEYQALQAQKREVEAGIELLRRRLADKRVVAPVAGRITDHRVDEGDYVGRGDLLATLYSLSAMEVRFTVGQQALGRVRTGQTVRLSVDAWPERTLTGRVTYVAPAVRAGTRQLPVVATVDHPEGLLKPGAFASAELTIETRRDVPTVPEEALIATRQGYEVFVVEGETARRREVTVGLRKPGWAEITEGLQVGQRVVRTGHMRLRDGRSVRVVEESTTRSTAPASRPAGPSGGPASPSSEVGDGGGR